MRIRPALAVATLAIAGGALVLRARAQPEGPGAALHAAIVEANRELERRFRDGDLAGVAAMYADDALLLGPGPTRVEGRDAVDAYWTRIAEPVDWTLEVFEVRGARDIAHQLGRSTLVVGRPDSDDTHTSVVDFALVWKRAASGEWRIAVDAYWPENP
ncbi:MAG: YybH family protein [Phycisphaerales bacterium]